MPHGAQAENKKFVLFRDPDQEYVGKDENPFGYSPIIQFIGGDAPRNRSVYTDGLLRSNRTKHDELCRKHFGNEGQEWGGRDPVAIEAFIRDWIGDDQISLCQVEEHCNNGNQVWKIDFFQPSWALPGR